MEGLGTTHARMVDTVCGTSVSSFQTGERIEPKIQTHIGAIWKAVTVQRASCGGLMLPGLEKAQSLAQSKKLAGRRERCRGQEGGGGCGPDAQELQGPLPEMASRMSKTRPLPEFANPGKALRTGKPRTPQNVVAGELESWKKVWQVDEPPQQFERPWRVVAVDDAARACRTLRCVSSGRRVNRTQVWRPTIAIPGAGWSWTTVCCKVW